MLKSNYESGDKSCGLFMLTVPVFIIVIIRFLIGISDKTIFSIVLRKNTVSTIDTWKPESVFKRLDTRRQSKIVIEFPRNN